MKKRIYKFISILLIGLLILSTNATSVYALGSVKLEDKSTDIDKIFSRLKTSIENEENFSFRQALGYRHSLESLEDIGILKDKIKINSNDSVANLAGNIISIISAGENPYDYKGVNYIEILKDSQRDDRKFIIGEWDDYISNQAFALIALDMAGADYHKESLDMVLAYQEDNGSFSSWGDIDSVGMALAALGNHVDKPEVTKAVDKSVEFIKANYKEQNQYSLSAAIQGLIAVGKDIPEDMVDSLLSFYNGEELFGDHMANEQVFLALSDYIQGQSMFKTIRFNRQDLDSIEILEPKAKIYVQDRLKLQVIGKDKSGKPVGQPELEWKLDREDLARIDKDGNLLALKPGRIKVQAQVKNTCIMAELKLDISEQVLSCKYLGDREIRNSSQFNSKVKIKNNTSKDQELVLIVGLYDKASNNLVNYSLVEKNLKGQEELLLGAGFLIPDLGQYYVKTLIWDSLEKQNIFMDQAIELKLAN